MSYLLDADVFIRAKNLHYGFDFCPAFWDWLIQQNRARQVYSIERIGGELVAGADDLADWAQDRGDGFFLSPDASLFPALASVANWSTGQSYDQAAVSTFLQVADYYLVGTGIRRKAYGRYPRGTLCVYTENQDSGRLHRPRHQVPYSLRDAEERPSSIRARSIMIC